MARPFFVAVASCANGNLAAALFTFLIHLLVLFAAESGCICSAPIGQRLLSSCLGTPFAFNVVRELSGQNSL
jgi:hypothetical protein